VRVQGGLNTIDIRYEYDALNRRTRQLVTAGTAPSLDFYYNNDWKIIEERIIDLNNTGDKATATASVSPICPTASLPVTTKIRAQYLYGVRDRNDLILRDYSADGTTAFTRHYVLSDAMLSTTAIADSTGAITQRFRYTAFGIPTHMTLDFVDTHANPANWQILLHGEYYDEDTAWSNYGHRFYAFSLGRWMSRDPIEEKGGINMFCFIKNNTISYFDIIGLAVPAIVIGAIIGGGVTLIVAGYGWIQDSICKDEVRVFRENCRRKTEEKKEWCRTRYPRCPFVPTQESFTCRSYGWSGECGGTCCGY
jgi:RHS repeat-associated protein